MTGGQHPHDTERVGELTARLGATRAQLARAAETAGRNVNSIELLPITKFFPASDILILHQLGCHAFGESREQEAANKIAEVRAELPEALIRWHMVGRIQRNKAKAVAGWAYAAHSVDSARLLTALDRASGAALEAGHRTEPLRIFLQISLDGDPERGGVDVHTPELVDELCAAAHSAEGLTFVGLMGVPPLGWDPDEAFAQLATERARVQKAYSQALELSAGMSGDLESAVRHGSTCVRVGTALMGERQITSPEQSHQSHLHHRQHLQGQQKGRRDEHTA